MIHNKTMPGTVLLDAQESLKIYKTWIEPDVSYNFIDFQPKINDWIKSDNRVLAMQLDNDCRTDFYMYGHTTPKGNEFFFGIFAINEANPDTELMICDNYDGTFSPDYLSVALMPTHPGQDRCFKIAGH